MSFPEKAESLRAKAHLSGVRVPVLVGVTALALVVLLAAGSFLLSAAATGGFAIEKADASAEEVEEDAAASAPAEPATIMVHVGGAVAQPGVRELPEGSRVQDAVDAAGGFTDGAAVDALNLARVLADGEQVIVPPLVSADEALAAAASSGSAAAATSSAGGKVNINTASASELDALAGIGPSTADKIVADREANGPFASPEDLKRVSGIGDKKYDALADAICVG